MKWLIKTQLIDFRGKELFNERISFLHDSEDSFAALEYLFDANLDKLQKDGGPVLDYRWRFKHAATGLYTGFGRREDKMYATVAGFLNEGNGQELHVYDIYIAKVATNSSAGIVTITQLAKQKSGALVDTKNVNWRFV